MSDEQVIRVSRPWRHLRWTPVALAAPGLVLLLASMFGLEPVFCENFAKACALDYTLARMSVFWFLIAGSLFAASWPMILASTAEIYGDRVRVGLWGYSRELKANEVRGLAIYQLLAHWWDFGDGRTTIRLYVNFMEDPERAMQRVMKWFEMSRRGGDRTGIARNSDTT